MKKIIICVLSILLLLICCGCNSENTDNRTPVTINLPTDDSVNGYRVSEPESSSEQTAESSKTETAQTETKYCANINSKVFHKITCSSVSNMKEENKAYFLDRSLLIDEGYTPCKRCNP